MPKANDCNTTNRRAFLKTIAVAAVAGAVMALTPSADADPIFAAIDMHRNTTLTFDRMFQAAGDGPYELHKAERLHAAIMAEFAGR
jgi:hypothetical protein